MSFSVHFKTTPGYMVFNIINDKASDSSELPPALSVVNICLKSPQLGDGNILLYK